jgi:hypothetical protein
VAPWTNAGAAGTRSTSTDPLNRKVLRHGSSASCACLYCIPSHSVTGWWGTEVALAQRSDTHDHVGPCQRDEPYASIPTCSPKWTFWWFEDVAVGRMLSIQLWKRIATPMSSPACTALPSEFSSHCTSPGVQSLRACALNSQDHSVELSDEPLQT